MVEARGGPSHGVSSSSMAEEIQTEGGELSEHRITAARLETMQALRESGVEPYPIGVAKPTATAAYIRANYAYVEAGGETGDIVTVGGRLVALRSFGKLRFGVLRDQTGDIQLFVHKAALEDVAFEQFSALDIGDWVVATGEVITTKKGELSVKLGTFELAAKSLRPLPEKWAGLQDKEIRFRQRYVDLIVNADARRTAHVRADVVRSLRNSYGDRGFMEVETPMLQVRPGGALAKPFVTHHNSLGIDMYLRIAPELYLKRLVVGGLEKVFEINRNFRNEGLDSTHNPEFTMLEAYDAYADYEDVMTMCETAFSEAVAVVSPDSFDIEYQGRALNLEGPYPRLPMTDAVCGALGQMVSVDTPRDELAALLKDNGGYVKDTFGPGKLIEQLFELLVEPDLWDPVFVTEHPVEISPLSAAHRSKPGVTERFELFVAGMEMANGFTELNDPIDQRARFEAQGAQRDAGDDEAHPIDEDYIRALEYGMPPTGGIGIGVDRLIMLLTDHSSIREVLLFPHMKPATN